MKTSFINKLTNNSKEILEKSELYLKDQNCETREHLLEAIAMNFALIDYFHDNMTMPVYSVFNVMIKNATNKICSDE